MNKRDDFLVEIHTEELPPQSLLKLAQAFCQNIKESLQKAQLDFVSATYFATPRRLAVLVHDLVAAQPDQIIERKGPALQAAFDARGNPTQACIGFARSCGVAPTQLFVIKNNQGEWVSFNQHLPGKSIADLLPMMVEQAAINLPIQKRMRWGASAVQFVRPVHSVMMLYGTQVIEATILGLVAGQKTRGHRFHAPAWLTIPHPSRYLSILASAGKVMADFTERRDAIRREAIACVQKTLAQQGDVLIESEDFLNEVTSLVEWPVALCGHFDDDFLKLPQEVLISSMQDHQRYFPVMAANHALLPYFITISNIQSSDAKRVIHGNERVLRARLADAAFFYATDKKEKLQARVQRLKGIVFQAKLGTLYEKAHRLSRIAEFIATKIGADPALANRAGLLAKTDLTTNMVNEFPELQGIMGYYYAEHDGEDMTLASALREHYLPRFALDALPTSPLGIVLALADRLDSLVGSFGINQIPTGDKDPYGLRRASLGVLRILIEKALNMDLKEIVAFTISCYANSLENPDTLTQLLSFMQERLRAWYQEQDVSADVFAAVAILGITNPYDMHARIKAVQAFKQLREADALCSANKRVSNILAKYNETIDAKRVDTRLLEHAAEQELAHQLNRVSEGLKKSTGSNDYIKILMQLAELHQPIDNFFDHVMVMTDDKQRRENRILLLSQLRALFLQVADIALLQ